MAVNIDRNTQCVCDNSAPLRCRCGPTWLLRDGLGSRAAPVCFDVVLPPSGAVENCYNFDYLILKKVV